MSHPRQILPGSTYLVTRRCAGRCFFLRPDGFVARSFGYLLAVAAGRFGVEVHCATVLSNHYHAVVTDRAGKLPRFLAWFHRLLAVVVNVYRGRWEAMWSSAKPSVVRLETPEDVYDKMLYVLSNPVAAGLVSCSYEWPGFSTTPEDLLDRAGTAYVRPDRYFDAAGRTPRSARLFLTRPPGFDDETDEGFVSRLRADLAESEAELRSGRKRAGERFLGARRTLRVPWSDSPTTRAPRRRRDPHVAARNEDVRRRALERLRRFRADYRAAFARWRDGDRDVRFPYGTYAMRVHLRVCCHGPPPREDSEDPP